MRPHSMRVIFCAEPADEADCFPKTLPDYESVGACWVPLDVIVSGTLPVRGLEPTVRHAQW